jgi:two-component system, OmpR family, sensor histidine kinase KdpD
MSAPERGKLKIFLGYAAGVGKTYQMLEDAQNLKTSGADIVIGYFEPHGRKDTISKTEGLEIVPRKRIEYRGSYFEEMDVDAILSRAPEICVVDEFPHTNIPGSRNTKRWEDVIALMNAGIDVLTTMNIQHLESLNDQVWQITGIRVRETIPDWVVEMADDVVMVDVTPRALLNRLERGVVYGRDKAEQAMQNFFREPTLVALRELALRQTAHEVEQRNPPDEAVLPPSGLLQDHHRHPHKILVLVTSDPTSAMLIRRARRVSDFLDAECFAVTVQPSGTLDTLPPDKKDAVERHLNFARNLHLETRVLRGEDVAQTLIDFARINQITQIFIARPHKRSWLTPLTGDLLLKVVELAQDMQVVIVSERELALH